MSGALWQNYYMQNINVRFSNHLKELRKKRKLTQEELAFLAGIDYKYVQNLESKKPSSPTLSTLEKLAKALKISVPKLVDFK